MVKLFIPKERKERAGAENKEQEAPRELDPHPYLFLVYVRWSRENRELKTYMRTRKFDSEIDMVCNGLADLVAEPENRLNSKNIKMAVLYQLDDNHDISRDFDVTGIVPTRLDHSLNSDYRQRIQFSQDQIDTIVNNTPFTYRAVK